MKKAMYVILVVSCVIAIVVFFKTLKQPEKVKEITITADSILVITYADSCKFVEL